MRQNCPDSESLTWPPKWSGLGFSVHIHPEWDDFVQEVVERIAFVKVKWLPNPGSDDLEAIRALRRELLPLIGLVPVPFPVEAPYPVTIRGSR